MTVATQTAKRKTTTEKKVKLEDMTQEQLLREVSRARRQTNAGRRAILAYEEVIRTNLSCTSPETYLDEQALRALREIGRK